MIQRQQSLWLLLAAVSAFLSYKLPFFSGTRLVDNLSTADELTGGSNFLLLVLTGACMLLAVVAIFLFKNRKLQFRMSITGAVMTVFLLVFYFLEARKFQTGSVSLSCLFVFAMLAGFIFAAKGIHNDEKLIKSLDKLR
jgi:LPXTG-motif cell wall-anchored protein